ncbi:hypothetical protein [Arthrobacter gallicola]|uniref:hypothetical protein n=1 Tax=Arthrobacter gallicola TaxID=2762225 RepID=UPI001CD87C7B|nr:hypothetical protein [Arthrobacter gallicola]
MGTLFAIDPAAAAVVGALALDQPLSPTATAGIGLVIASGAAIIWRSGSPGRDAAVEIRA